MGESLEPKQLFKITINLNEDDDEPQNRDYQFTEEFSYQQIIQRVISRIDHKTLARFSDQNISNPYQDIFGFFVSTLKEAISRPDMPNVHSVISQNSSSLDPVINDYLKTIIQSQQVTEGSESAEGVSRRIVKAKRTAAKRAMTQ